MPQKKNLPPTEPPVLAPRLPEGLATTLQMPMVERVQAWCDWMASGLTFTEAMARAGFTKGQYFHLAQKHPAIKNYLMSFNEAVREVVELEVLLEMERRMDDPEQRSAVSNRDLIEFYRGIKSEKALPPPDITINIGVVE